MAATAGGITGWPLHRFALQSRLRVGFAADYQRLEVIDGSLRPEPQSTSPTPNASGCRSASIRRLLVRCADPNLRDPKHDTTPLEKASEKAAASRRMPSCWRRPAGPAAYASQTRPARRNPTGPEPARKRRETTVQVPDLRHGTPSSSAASSINLGRYNMVTAGRYQRP